MAGELDRLNDSDRIAAVTALTPSEQSSLWESASKATGRDGVLIGRPEEGSSQRYAGRNSLGMFSRFEKRFFRRDGRIFGYNAHSLSPLIGPGYFAVAPRDGGGYRFDYRELPDVAPAGWPRVRSNDSLLSRSVYGRLVDEVIWVSRDVLVGAAFRGDVPLNSYFVLVRITE